MRPSPRLTSMLLGAALLVAAGAPSVAAQSPSASPTVPQVCEVLSADEVSAALGVTVTVTSGGSTDCELDADYAAGNYVSLTTHLDTGDLDTIRTVMCGLGSSVSASPSPAAGASTAPCGIDLQISGVPALYLPEMGALLYVAPTAGSLFNLQLIGEPADGVDKQAAMTNLAELALGRLASMPLPTTQPVPSQQALEGDAELEAMLPTQIGGVDVTTQSMSGKDLTTGGGVPAEFTAAIAAIGKTMDDVSAATGYALGESGTYSAITAFRVRGTDMSSLQATLLPILLKGQGAEAETTLQVAGKNVTAANVAGNMTYFYPHGDILWVVAATDPALTEIFQKLP